MTTMLVVLGTTALVGCGDPSETSSPVSGASSTVSDSSSVSPTSAPATTVDVTTTSAAAPSSAATDASVPRHLDHAGLAAALPISAQFPWLPATTVQDDDTDLTSRLMIGDCSGQSTVMLTREESATNRLFSADQDALAEVTFYDVETVEDAGQYLAALDAFVGCPSSPSPEVSFDVIALAASTSCDEAFGIRTHQPVSETIDEWCRVGNLIAWIRLYPTGVTAPEMDSSAPPPVAPTDDQANAALVAVGQNLRMAWDASG
ncbi:MAG TPA: hypothetical protein PK020_05235 [Ilumatobacteraceae bacterium]|nr:hypothetical protein [Ilumatobacteraceae bacterium]